MYTVGIINQQGGSKFHYTRVPSLRQSTFWCRRCTAGYRSQSSYSIFCCANLWKISTVFANSIDPIL